MVTRLHARVLLDTGPDEPERRYIQDLFRRARMTAEVAGHSYGGPPPTSAFLIVVNVPLAEFLEQFWCNGEPGLRLFTELVRGLLATRADPARWGRAHSLKLEDAHTRLGVFCPGGLPGMRDSGRSAVPPGGALGELLGLDFAGFGRGSPQTAVHWHDPPGRWLATVQLAGRQLRRRLPARAPGPPGLSRVRQLSPAETSELWQLTEQTGSVVRWQRAYVVLLSGTGWSTSAIASKTLLSPQRVRDVIDNFNSDGLAALDSGYHSRRPYRPTAAEDGEAAAIAAMGPASLGLDLAGWDRASLGDYLVGHGVTEDVGPRWLEDLIMGENQLNTSVEPVATSVNPP